MARLIATYIALMALLALTVFASGLALGPYHTTVSLGIAVAKALLVVWIFMELGTGPALVRLSAGAALLWIFFFYLLAALDFGFRATMPV